MRHTAQILLLLALATSACQRAPEKTLAELEAMALDARPETQLEGVQGFVRLGPKAQTAVPTLIRALKASEQATRQTAALALSQVGPAAKEAVPALIEALSDPEDAVRQQAAAALGQIGPDAQEALPALEKMSKGADSCKSAEKAIQKIRP